MSTNDFRMRPAPSLAGETTINAMYDAAEAAAREAVLTEFNRLGMKASEHYADDSTREWDKADKAKREALAIFDAHPDLHPQMREIGLGFLWLLGRERPR